MPEVPKILRILLPPVWLLIFLITQFLFYWKLPGPIILDRPWNLIGILPIFIAIGLVLWAHELFVRAGTDVVPFKNVTAFVSTGPYRFTRNPMYLAITLILLGVAMLLGVTTPFLVIPLFMAVITILFIRREEILMESKFGLEYLNYKQSVRRWL